MLVRTWMLIWKIFVSTDLKFGDSRMLHFCSEHVFNKWNRFNHNKGMKFCVFLCFKSLDLRCEMTVIPWDWVSGHDRVVSKHQVHDLNGNLLSLPLEIDD